MIGDIYQNSEIVMATEEAMVKRQPTSIKIDEELWAELKILAIKEKTTATELLEEGVRDLIIKKSKAKGKK